MIPSSLSSLGVPPKVLVMGATELWEGPGPGSVLIGGLDLEYLLMMDQFLID